MLRRLFIFLAVVGAECIAGSSDVRGVQPVGESLLPTPHRVQPHNAPDSAERLKRRDALREALRTHNGNAHAQPAPQQRSPEDRAALRAQLRDPSRGPLRETGPAPQPGDPVPPVRPAP